MRPFVLCRVEVIVAATLVMTAAVGPSGCRNPAQSSLPPSAIVRSSAALPSLPKGDVYADETVASAETLIEPGDSMDVLIRRGISEEKWSGVVKENGIISLSFLEISVGGITAAQAEERIREKAATYMRDPRVQVALRKKTLRVKRVFVFGDVKKPGMYPMSRHMTVLHALALAENYNETALLDEVRVVRGNLNQPDIYTADLARLFTYGDYNRNLALEENDIVFVPREHLGDSAETAKKLMPLIQAAVMPLYPA